MIPPAIPSALIWCGQQCLGFGTVEEVNQTLQTAFAGDGQYSLDLRSVSRFLVSGIVEERTDRGQTEVATPGRDLAIGLQVIQESRDQGSVDIFKCEI
jgi:hypothetical protein